MRLVLDSSVAFKWVVPETDTDKALRLRDDARGGVHELLAPDVFPIEVGHALTRAERQTRLAVGAGWTLWQSVMSETLALHPALPLMPRAYAISAAARIGIYDCLYVALAEQQGCSFVTADTRLLTNLQAQFPFLVALGSLP
jgi:predicted nucleic acid-binding protein